jgi:hypothetical protein
LSLHSSREFHSIPPQKEVLSSSFGKRKE